MVSKEDIAAGASGLPLTPEDKQESNIIPEPAPDKPQRKSAKRAKKAEEVEILERRLAELEAKVAAHDMKTHTCHMCHKPGATIQRGNTGEWFHGPCLSDFKQGKDPLPQ